MVIDMVQKRGCEVYKVTHFRTVEQARNQNSYSTFITQLPYKSTSWVGSVMTTTVLRLTIRYAFPQVPCDLVVTSVKYQDTPPHEASLSHELLGGAAAYEV